MLSLRTRSFRRYRIQGAIPSPYGEEFAQRLTDRKFVPLRAEEERAYGWVTAENLLLTTFDVDTLIHGEYAAFALRVDRRRVNPRLLRAQVDLVMRGRRAASADGAGPARISRDERRQMREDARQELLRQTNPAIDAFTVWLHPKRRCVHVQSLSRAVNDLVRMHFLDTFDAELLPLTPWRRGQELLAKGGDPDRLDELRRTELFPVGTDGVSPEGALPARAPDTAGR